MTLHQPSGNTGLETCVEPADSPLSAASFVRSGGAAPLAIETGLDALSSVRSIYKGSQFYGEVTRYLEQALCSARDTYHHLQAQDKHLASASLNKLHICLDLFERRLDGLRSNNRTYLLEEHTVSTKLEEAVLFMREAEGALLLEEPALSQAPMTNAIEALRVAATRFAKVEDQKFSVRPPRQTTPCPSI